MAKVANRVRGRRDANLGNGSIMRDLKTGRILDTKVSVSTGFKGLRDMNRKALTSLKH
jgi:hypothetical protein